MKLTVEFYKDFDPSVLDDMDYVYAFRVLYMEGPREYLLEAIRIIDSVTSDRAIVLKGGKDEQEAQETKKPAEARGEQYPPSPVPAEALGYSICEKA